MAIVISKNVPLPEARSSARTEAGAAIRRLEIGDSFAVPVEKTAMATANKLHNFARDAGVKITTRSLIEDGAKVVRTWRIA